MQNVITVKSAEYVTDHILSVTFNDGVKADIDFTRWIEKYPFFAPLRDVEYFKNFSLDGWTVSWPNGADVAPETLHKMAVRSLENVSA